MQILWSVRTVPGRRCARWCPPAVPAYAGLSFVELDLIGEHRDAADLIGTGLMFALGNNRGFLAHREPDRLHVYVALRLPEGAVPTGKDELLAEFAGWDERFLDLIRSADGPLVPRPIHALPIGHRWPRVPGVTLLGDAAHLMSPFAGEGANLALLDAADLAGALLEHRGDTEAALTQYEQLSFRAVKRRQLAGRQHGSAVRPGCAGRRGELLRADGGLARRQFGVPAAAAGSAYELSGGAAPSGGLRRCTSRRGRCRARRGWWRLP